jgi:Xaa-Pro aminopeptidase
MTQRCGAGPGHARPQAAVGHARCVIESESYKRFYMHRTSHWLGKDVHDAGEYKEGEQWAR